jgi:PilZ domain.
MLCADLVEVQWRDKNGKLRRAIANLEDISLSGACVQLEVAIPLNTTLRIVHGKGALHGQVRYCVYREIGYFLGIEFDPDCKWSQSNFRPQHLLDPRKLVARTQQQASDQHTA